MSIPNADRALIDHRKLVDYLLSSDHPVGRFKAQFFNRLGFTPDRAELLAQRFKEILRDATDVMIEETPFGVKYIVNGTLTGPNGVAGVRVVWIVETGSDVPRFVTAYPRSTS